MKKVVIFLCMFLLAVQYGISQTTVEEDFLRQGDYGGNEFVCKLTEGNRDCISSILNDSYNSLGIEKSYNPNDPEATIIITDTNSYGKVIESLGYYYNIKIQYNLVLREGILIITTDAFLIEADEQVSYILRNLRIFLNDEIFNGLHTRKYELVSVTNRVGKTTARFRF